MRFSLISALLLSVAACDNPWPRAGVANAQGVARPHTTTRRLMTAEFPFSADWTSPTPDGKALVTTDWATGGVGLMDIASSKIRSVSRVVKPYASGMAGTSRASRDGKWIAYTWDSVRTTSLRVIDTTGKQERTLYSSVGRVAPQDWSPDGRTIVATVSRPQGMQILLIPFAGGANRILKTVALGQVGRILFSSDGRYLAFDRGRPNEPGRSEVVSLSIADGQETVLMGGDAHTQLYGWSPSGRHVLILSNRTGSPGAWLLPVTDGRARGEPTLVKPDLWRATPIGFTNGASFMYGVATGDHSIYVAAFDPSLGKVVGSPAPLAQSSTGTTATTNLEWSPDGRTIAYRVTKGIVGLGGSGVGGTNTIVLHSRETGEMKQFPTSLVLGYDSEMRWLPDGTALVIKARSGDRVTFQKFDIQTGRATELFAVARDTMIRGFDLSPDDKSIVLTGTAKKGSQAPDECFLAMRDLASAVQRVLHRGTCRANWEVEKVAVSPDGQSIAFIRGEGATPADARPPQLFVIPTAGGTPRAILTASEIIWSMVWVKDARSLIAAQRDKPGTSWSLWRIPTAGGDPQRIGVTMDEMRQVRISPDGRSLAFDAGKLGGELWMMSGFVP
jgi:Tol biopolymer transport system component